MRQSTVIFGTLLFAFVIYITMRGQLDDYFNLFRRAPGQPISTPTETPNVSNFPYPIPSFR